MEGRLLSWTVEPWIRQDLFLSPLSEMELLKECTITSRLVQVMAMQRSGNLNQEEELEMALRLSQQQVYFPSKDEHHLVLNVGGMIFGW